MVTSIGVALDAGCLSQSGDRLTRVRRLGPQESVPTSFLLQFKRALPPVLPEEMSAIVGGIGHTEKSLSSI